MGWEQFLFEAATAILQYGLAGAVVVAAEKVS